MSEPVWVIKSVVLAIHAEQLAEHSGESGLRDDSFLDFALERPRNLFAYWSKDLFDLAATYACGIMESHPFLDGNKRTAFVTSLLFLELNGVIIEANREDKVTVFLQLASHQWGEKELALWFKQNQRELG